MPGKENDTKRHYHKITFVGDSLEGMSMVASGHGMGNSLKGAEGSSGGVRTSHTSIKVAVPRVCTGF